MRFRATTANQLVSNVGRRVAEVRESLGLTQESFAADLDVSSKYVQSVEAGRENLSLRTVAKIAATLRVEPASLLTPPTTPKRRPGRPKAAS